MDLDGVGRPDVNGAFETDEAPEKAGAPAAAEGLAMVLFMGFRTLGMVLEEMRKLGRVGKRMGCLRVDNVDDTVGDEDVGGDDLGA
jgi:hypothetical protein